MTRVLIADDHPMILDGIISVLENTDYEVVAAVADGAEALHALPSARPHLLLLDLAMPNRGGLDVLRMLRSRGDHRLVIFLMADIDERRLREALLLGVNGVILKRSAPAELIACMDQVVGGRRWVDPALQEKVLSAAFTTGEAVDPLETLTPRERTVAKLACGGLRNQEIGDELGISGSTVKMSLHGIYEKLGVKSRADLIRLFGRFV
jgi:two-component system nitrate/nitrite response regulator NarP